MNENIHPDSESDLLWPNGARRVPGPSTSMLQENDDALPPATVLLNNAVQGAHDTIDHLADGAAPVVQQLGERVSAAEDALNEKAVQLRETRDQWADSVRTKVRDNPLMSIAAAVALGAVFARLARSTR